MTDEAKKQPPVCLVTRPQHQTRQLIDLLNRSGFGALLFPTIAIMASGPTAQLENLQNEIHEYDIALFVSRNAVDFSFKFLDSSRLPERLQLGVIGRGSWLALQQQGVESHIIPAESYNSEGLLASPSLQQVAGKRILILRGQQGRNLLGDTLRERGARVDYLEVYRRVVPQYADDALEQLSCEHFPDIALFTSAEGLRNCFDIVSASMADRLRQIPWLLISERMRETARDLGHNAAIIIAISASDEGIVQALQQWQQTTINHHP